MRYENAVVKKINDIYLELKKEREEEALKRKQEVYKKFPRVEEIDDEIATSALRVASKIAEGNHSVEELSKELMETLRSLKTEKGNIYKANNIPLDYTDEKFKCEKCKDTGYIKGEKCTCFLEYLAKSVYELSNIPMSAKGHVQFVSGFSQNLFDQIMRGKNAYTLMMDKLNEERYACIH